MALSRKLRLSSIAVTLAVLVGCRTPELTVAAAALPAESASDFPSVAAVSFGRVQRDVSGAGDHARGFVEGVASALARERLRNASFTVELEPAVRPLGYSLRIEHDGESEGTGELVLRGWWLEDVTAVRVKVEAPGRMPVIRTFRIEPSERPSLGVGFVALLEREPGR